MNGVNLGRYWPVVGPQVTLYVPKGTLKAYPGTNTLTMVELESAQQGCDPESGLDIGYHTKPPPVDTSQSKCFVELVDTPVVSGRCFAPGKIEQITPHRLNEAKDFRRGS